eukprot:TRINITY_DN4379_c0_g1_i2.p2 TRINITY_DN4379_c0_g1~~TRINITY_DN4379_c0_g1_i2.p2  ORF type:complete len:126 (+),score=26.29 TRINITY_DN4379_c0_g1_i2:101-478(+)
MACTLAARPIQEMPERKTDGSRVVDAAKDLVYLMCVKGGTKLLKREKGLEKQFRYNCELCDVCVAYRPVPYEKETKYIYIFPEGVHPHRSVGLMPINKVTISSSCNRCRCLLLVPEHLLVSPTLQ